MSSMLRQAITVFYWPSGKAGGKGVGHLSVLLRDGTYVSHVPDRSAQPLVLSTRKDIPTLEGVSVKVERWPSIRNRTFADDEALFGKNLQSLSLPSTFIELFMSQFASGRMLATRPGGQPLHGPLPYYQLADSVKGGEEDRSQCTTTSAKMIAAGVPLEHQDIAKRILGEYQPDSLWNTLLDICKRLAGQG